MGLALKIRCPEIQDPDDGDWDILLATSGTSAVTRVLPLPAKGWNTARYSSLMPYSSDGRDIRWLLAEPLGRQPSGTSLDALRNAVSKAPLEFALHLKPLSGPAVPAGRVTLSRILEGDDHEQPSFDPVLHRPRRVRLLPEWLAGVRVGAYRGSREGREVGTERNVKGRNVKGRNVKGREL
ncbi:MAG: hypothetical protein WAW17_02375 [Rhodococcus sp. (in: high G+C Gram-positive bacteria)]|uniref:hypothetical protein n=1 Tax=Rhodococcus sp. TaxID=1831 RepID=UPI003BAE7679